MQIIHYLTADDKDLYQDWLDGLRDMRARVAIQRRVDRLARGNFGETTMSKKPHRDHEEATIESFQNDPRFAAEYLNAVLEDGDQQELMTALRYLAKAFGGVSRLAEQAELNATTLYRTLSRQGNPELKSLTALLKAMGMRLAVQPIDSAKADFDGTLVD